MSVESSPLGSQAQGSSTEGKKATAQSSRVNARPDYEEIFRQMAENIQEIFWMLDAFTYEVIYVSPAFEKICGFPCQSLYDAPTSYREVIHPDDRVRVLAHLEELPASGRFDEEFRIVRPDGVVRWVHTIGFVARDSGGRVTRLVGTVQDITKRNAAEDLLRDSEERYRDLVENSLDLICTHDLDGQLLSVNEAPARILGYKPEELIKKPMKELVPVEFRDQFDEYLARIKQDGFAEGLLAVQTRSGERRIWRYRNTLRTADISRPIVRGIAHDITDLKRAEKALRLSEQKFSKAFHGSPVAMSITTAVEGRFIEVNDSFVKQSGYRREELIGRTDTELKMWHEPVAREQVVQEMQATGRLRDLEMKFQTKAGKVLDAKFSVEPIVLESGPCLLTVAEDVTERKRTDKALRRSETDYRSLFEAVPHGIFRATPEGRFLVANPAFAQMLGFASQSDVLAANLVTDVFADPTEHETAMRECCKRERFENVELRWKRQDGEPLRVRASGRLVRNEAGHPAYCEVMVEDVTEQRALEEQLRQSQKMDAIALLANGISHDFNTVLTGILGHSELLLMSPDLPERERKRVEAVVDAAVQARSITQQLLAFGRSQSSEPEFVNLNGAIARLRDFLKRMVGPCVELSEDLRPDLGDVSVDPTQLTQVIMNLVANARDAMPRGGKVAIKTDALDVVKEDHPVPGIRPGHYAVLAISDTGVGMDEKVQSRIFEPFFTTKSEGKGTGLGLAMVHGIIQQNGGYVRVMSRPGEGATFKIFLPLTQEVPSKASPARGVERRKASGCETILVVDDHDLTRGLTRDFLSMHGYEVLSARSGLEAIQIAKKHTGPIHLLVTDILMPRMTGPVLSKQLAGLHPETKVIYMTAYADLMDFGDIGIGNQRELLRKPFMQHELMSRVRHILGETVPQ